MPPALKLEKGYESGDLVVVSSPILVIQKNGRNRGYKHICMCKCGKRCYCLATDLRRGEVRSCKKCAYKNLEKRIKIGDVFGKLTVTSDVPVKVEYGVKKKTSISTYKCKCECGAESYFRLKSLFGSSPKMCKTCAVENRTQDRSFNPYARLFKMSFNGSRTKKRKISNSLTISQFQDIVSKNCHYCGSEPVEKRFLNRTKVVRRPKVFANGIDRVDSNSGYSESNCVPCCAWCNVMKSNRTVAEFYEQINKILKYRENE